MYIFPSWSGFFSIPQANPAGIFMKDDCTNKRECKLKCYRKTSVSVVRGKSSVGQAYVRLMGLKESLYLYAAKDKGSDQISEMKTGDICTSAIIKSLKIVTVSMNYKGGQLRLCIF